MYAKAVRNKKLPQRDSGSGLMFKSKTGES